MSLLFYLLLVVAGGSAREFTDEDIFKFPSLFHLDDYNRCLSQKNGLYCVGTFALTPATQHHPTYDLMNVSARCPSAERNTSLRFEHCAAQWGRERALRTTLHTLHYCRTYKDTQIVNSRDIWQRLYKYIICFILFLNIIGTMYDLTTTESVSKNEFLIFWSIRLNWKKFTATYQDGDPRLNALNPIQGARVLIIIIMLFIHTGIVRYRTFLHNPEFLEQIIDKRYAQILLGSIPATQALLVLSSYLTCYNLMLIFEKYPLSLEILPVYILKRLSRISPSYLLVIGFVITWWPLAYDGPIWPLIVTAQSKICLRKFWSQVFHINNMVDKDLHCVPPTWFLAADFHINILAVIVTVIATRMRRHVLKTLVALYISSCLLITGIAYIYDLKSTLHFYTVEKLRNTCSDEFSFYEYYISSWSSIPTCFLGVFMGYLQYEHTTKGFKIEDYKWFVVLHNISFPLLLIWMSMSIYIKEYTSPLATSLFILIERPVFCLLGAVLLYGAINIDGPVRRIWGWHGFQSLGRLSLSIMLVNWPIAETLEAVKHQPVSTSFIGLVLDGIVIIILTLLVALPLTILVEIPMRRWLAEIIFKYFIVKKLETLDSTVVKKIMEQKAMKLK